MATSYQESYHASVLTVQLAPPLVEVLRDVDGPTAASFNPSGEEATDQIETAVAFAFSVWSSSVAVQIVTSDQRQINHV